MNLPKPNRYPLNTHRYLVLPGLIGGSPRGVGDPDQQPHLHHGTAVLKMNRVPASPAGQPRPYRRPSCEGLSERERRRCCSVLCPPSPGVSMAATTPLWGSRGRRNPRPGNERREGRRREREREISQGLADPGARHQMVLRQLDGLRQRRRAVALDPLGRSTGKPSDELLQHHQIDHSLDIALLSHEPLAASIPELLSHHKWSAMVP